MRPMSPKNGGAGEGSFPRLKTIPTAKPVKSASVMAPMVGIPLCKITPPYVRGSNSSLHVRPRSNEMSYLGLLLK